MTDTFPTNSTDGAGRYAEVAVAAPGIARWLSLAASPTFAVMALLTAGLSGGQAEMHGAAGHGSPVGGMTLMYLLMGVFHSAPWLQLIFRQRSGERRS